MRIAAIDIGSNSLHLVVADVSQGGRIEILDRAKEMVRLGESLRNEVIAPEPFRRGIEALRTLKRITDRHQPDALVAVEMPADAVARAGSAKAVKKKAGRRAAEAPT
jgi:exopolyphosphatase / guanosine-5'-triphosphate,3'-diphosphate pyrophosphatase